MTFTAPKQPTPKEAKKAARKMQATMLLRSFQLTAIACFILAVTSVVPAFVIMLTLGAIHLSAAGVPALGFLTTWGATWAVLVTGRTIFQP